MFIIKSVNGVDLVVHAFYVLLFFNFFFITMKSLGDETYEINDYRAVKAMR